MGRSFRKLLINDLEILDKSYLIPGCEPLG